MTFALGLAMLLATDRGSVSYRPGYQPNACVVQVEGERRLVGTTRCMRGLPLKTVKGYLTVGPEEACFTTIRQHAGQSCRTALDIPDKHPIRRSDGRRRIYAVSALVRGNGMRGYYGHGGMSPFGYRLIRFTSYRQIAELR